MLNTSYPPHHNQELAAEVSITINVETWSYEKEMPITMPVTIKGSLSEIGEKLIALGRIDPATLV